MKIHFKHGKREFRFEHEPLEKDKFYALVVLAAGVLVVALVLGGIALK